MSKRCISEQKMADVFEKLLRDTRRTSEFPPFHSIFREVKCQQGIADFIAIAGNYPSRETRKVLKDIHRISNNSTFHILALLKHRAPRTESFITRSTGLSNQIVRRILKQLEHRAMIKKVRSGGVILGPQWRPPKFDLWAFELKLKNWKRALFQALQYRAFATHVVIVLPKERSKIVMRHLDKFKTMKVGVMMFDINKRKHEIIIQPAKVTPSSKLHYFHTLGNLIAISNGDHYGVVHMKREDFYKKVTRIFLNSFDKFFKLIFSSLKMRVFQSSAIKSNKNRY